jgi:hypothetical protein
MNWLRKLLGLCPHKWETIQVQQLEQVHYGYRVDGKQATSLGTRYHLRCAQCGNIKFRNVI